MKNTKTAKSKDFAVINTGGKQYMVSVDDVINVELLKGHQPGDKVEFTDVLLKNDKVGKPTVAKSKVTGTYIEAIRGKKLSIIRFKAKSNRSRKQGHRQNYSRVKIESIS